METFSRSSRKYIWVALAISPNKGVPYAGSISLEDTKRDLGPFGDEQIDRVFLATIQIQVLYGLWPSSSIYSRFYSGWESDDILFETLYWAFWHYLIFPVQWRRTVIHIHELLIPVGFAMMPVYISLHP